MYLLIYLSIHLFIYLYICLSIYLSFYPSLYLSLDLFIHISILISFSLSIYIFVYPYIYLAIHLFFYNLVMFLYLSSYVFILIILFCMYFIWRTSRGPTRVSLPRAYHDAHAFGTAGSPAVFLGGLYAELDSLTFNASYSTASSYRLFISSYYPAGNRVESDT